MTSKLENQPMTLNRVRTPKDLMAYLNEQKAELGSTLIGTFLRAQKPKNNFYIVSVSTGIPLSVLQKISSALENIHPGDDMSDFSHIEFQHGAMTHLIVKNGTKKKDEMEYMQSSTGGAQSESIEDMGSVRVMYFPLNGNLPPAVDCPVYKFL